MFKRFLAPFRKPAVSYRDPYLDWECMTEERTEVVEDQHLTLRLVTGEIYSLEQPGRVYVYSPARWNITFGDKDDYVVESAMDWLLRELADRGGVRLVQFTQDKWRMSSCGEEHPSHVWVGRLGIASLRVIHTRERRHKFNYSEYRRKI